MSWESVPKHRDRNQLFDLRCDVAAYITLGRTNFPDQFTTSVDNGDQVFRIQSPTRNSRLPSIRCLREARFLRITKMTLRSLYRRNCSSQVITGISSHKAWAMI